MRAGSRGRVAWCTAIVTGVAVVATLAPVTATAALRVAWRRDTGRELRAVVVDASGNAYVTGYVRTGARRLRTLLVTKYGPDGRRRWSDTWRPASDSQTVGNDIALGADGRIFVAGTMLTTDDDGQSGWFVRAYGPGGTARWHRDQPGWRGQPRRGNAVAIDASGNVVVATVTMEGGTGYHEGSVRRYNAEGDHLWTNDFEVSGYGTYDRATDVAVGAGGGVYVVGEIDQKQITPDRQLVDQEIVVQRLEAGSGNARWILVMKDRNVRDADTATGVAVRGDVLAVVARIDGGPVTGPRAERGHTWVARLGTASAAVLWERVWGEANRKAAEPAAVAIGPGGTVRVAGTVRGTGDGVDAFLRSFTAGGGHAGSLRMRSGRFLHGTDVAAARSGGRLWLTAWRGTHDDDRPDGGHLWQLRP